MKKLFVFIISIFLYFNALAQLEVKPGSFKEVTGFVNINTDIMEDDNNVLYAVVKVNTENINDKERHQLLFQGNAATFIELEYKVGEVWVYLSSKPATYLKISHPDYGSTEFWFPQDLEPKKGYEMVLVNKTQKASAGSGILIVSTKPENGASITLNGKPLGQITPYKNDVIASGEYEITVSKFGFGDVTKSVTINENATTRLELEMPYLYGSLKITSEPSESIVFIDDVECGKTPLSLDKIKYGTHKLKVVKNKWNAYYGQFDINNDSLASINVVLNQCPNGAINGVFSVSPTKKVYFSKGNLLYNKETKQWFFAENQWKLAKNLMKVMEYKYIAENYPNCIDLFDWQTCHKVSKEIQKTDRKKWRTLTKDEWHYLLHERKTKSGISYVQATVNSVNGLVLLPDDWNSSYYNLKMVADKYDSNNISYYEWTHILEPHGAVFLPAAKNDYIHGYYWSSTPWEKNKKKSAYYIDFYEWQDYYKKYSSFSINIDADSKGIGLSVRLVCDTE